MHRAARRFYSFGNTKRAFDRLSTKELLKHRSTYKVLGAIGKFDGIGDSLIKGFMKARVPGLYPLVEDMMYSQFCGGETLGDLSSLVGDLHEVGVTPLLNYGVEYSEDEKDLDDTMMEMLRAISFLKGKEGTDPGSLILRATGLMSAGRLARSQMKELGSSEEGLWTKDLARLETVCEQAAASAVPLLIDAETIDIQEKIHALSIEQMRELNRNGKANIFSTIQFYRKDCHDQLEELLEDGEKHGYQVGLKLVRGAYMHDEEQAGRRGDIWGSKAETNQAYNRALEILIPKLPDVSICIASHNEETVEHAIKLMQDSSVGGKDKNVHFAQMHGMRKDLTFNLTDHNVLSFIPYGRREFLFPYLVRRGLENSSALGGASKEVENMTSELNRRTSPFSATGR